jgi:Uma2 family endonuclease
MGRIEPAEVFKRHLLTVDEYYRMAEVGVLAADARVELIEGEVVDMASIGTRHASRVTRLNQLLTAAVGQAAIVAVQNPVRLSQRSEPQPDIAVLRPRADFYESAHPTPADVLLLVEVSDTTSRYDLEIKAPLYARHGIQELWVVDLDNHVLLVHRQPGTRGWGEVLQLEAPGTLAPRAFPHAVVDLAELL